MKGTAESIDISGGLFPNLTKPLLTLISRMCWNDAQSVALINWIPDGRELTQVPLSAAQEVFIPKHNPVLKLDIGFGEKMAGLWIYEKQLRKT